MNTEPKPATGTKPSAWALRQVDKNMDEAIDAMFPKPASGERWTQDALILRIAELEQQLAAANDMWDRASRQADTLAEYLVDAKTDLAVAQDQLAAEREKVRALRDALVKAQHRFNKSGWPEAAKEIEDVLARH